MSSVSDFTDGFVDRIWFGDDAIAAVSRAVLLPAERVFGGIVGARDVLYDAGWLTAHPTALPAVSVGNLTVGGTGKTPIAAWIAARAAAARGEAGGDSPRLRRRRAARSPEL